jgi:hypothetical protein
VASNHPDGNDGQPGVHECGQVSAGLSDFGLNDKGALGATFVADLAPK